MKITEPTLLIDVLRCRANIHRMAEKARKHGLKLKPHFKTHQSAQIGEWFREEGVNGITVTSVKMANYFADHGWDDITIAFPVNILQASAINALAERVQLTVFINSIYTANQLGNGLKKPVRVRVEIDTGNQRTGIPSSQKGEINQLLEAISDQKHLDLQGFYVHPGHTYQARSRSEVKAIYESTREQLVELQELMKAKFGQLSIAIGDTPSASLVDSWEGVDQMHPGNFVFYDLMQQQIGACDFSEIAVCMACPIVEKQAERQELIIHGGAVHFSKDRLTASAGHVYFGQVARLSESGWSNQISDCYVKALSQEHGIVRVSPAYFEEVQVGDVIGVLPVHSCLTANLMKEYQTMEGEKLSMM